MLISRRLGLARTDAERIGVAQYACVVSESLCLIVNPAAGGGKAGRVLPEVSGALEGRGFSVRSELTRDLDHARELAREAAGDGETVVCLSGDGMVGAVADVLREIPDALLGVLPGGRGNDLARVLGIPADPVQACDVIAAGFSRPMDLGEVGPATGTSFGGQLQGCRRDGRAERLSWGSRAWASTAKRTGSQTRHRLGWAGLFMPMVRCAHCCRGARLVSRSSWILRASVTASRFTAWVPPTRRPMAAV